MADRSFQSDTTFYKYTGKERDVTTGYDYFGARYYISRVGNWMSIDPLFEKHFDFSPYNYVLRNPVYYIDPDGNQVAAIPLAGAAVIVIAVEAAVYTGAVVGAVYLAYKGAELLAEQYEMHQSATISAEVGQEQVQIINDPIITNPTYESRNKNIKKDIRGAVNQVISHLNKISLRMPNVPDPNDDRNIKDWVNHIKKHIGNIKKYAERLKKDPQKVIEELVQKGQLDRDRVIKAVEELKKYGIEL